MRIRYEVPELSKCWGSYVTTTTLWRAKRLARAHGCDAVWEVQGAIPQLAGRIWGYVDGQWVVVDESAGICTCGHCDEV